MISDFSLFGLHGTVTGNDHTDRVLLRYYEFLITVSYLGAYQIFRQKYPEGILKYIFFGVLLLNAVLISAKAIVGTKPQLSDSPYLLGIFDNLDMR